MPFLRCIDRVRIADKSHEVDSGRTLLKRIQSGAFAFWERLVVEGPTGHVLPEEEINGLVGL